MIDEWITGRSDVLGMLQHLPDRDVIRLLQRLLDLDVVDFDIEAGGKVQNQFFL